ncbi:eukaryotic translation elongation factor 1 delta [Carabus blaptoides fortunei]
MSCLANEKIWVEKPIYDEAEREYYKRLAKAPLTPLADEVAKARQRLIEIKDTFDKDVTPAAGNEQFKCLENKIIELTKVINSLQSTVKALESRLVGLENKCIEQCITTPVNLKNVPQAQGKDNRADDDDDDDVDLFGSDSDGEDDAAAKIREERLAAYAAKKSKKPALIAKSNIILDVKPWDDETDMKAMEAEVRKIKADGLLLGAAKLVPLAYGIHKLQISCVIEDDKISVDWLQEQIESIEDFVQSVDIAAFNKI